MINRIAQLLAIIKMIFGKIHSFWIHKVVRNRFGVKPLAQTGDSLEQWLNGSFGQELLSEEKELVDRALTDLYGFHLMQLGISRHVDLTEASTINHRFAFTPSSLIPSSLVPPNSLATSQLPPSPLEKASLEKHKKPLLTAQADIEKIPLGSESIDVALLHHVLEFTENPHQLLRETARVIIPRGYVVIVGFNPFSWFGVFKQFGRWFTQKTHWRHHSLRLGRVLDWLTLLDFEPVSIEQGFYRWPIDHSSVMEKTRWYERVAKKTKLPMGGFYIIVARKDVVGMTPLKPSWKKFNPIESFVGSRPRSGAATDTARANDKADSVNKTTKKLKEKFTKDFSSDVSHKTLH
ncbi:MAG: class I SAM-dependent methyltransferase [Cellvibrionaceae bacterium]